MHVCIIVHCTYGSTALGTGTNISRSYYRILEDRKKETISEKLVIFIDPC